MTSGANYSLGAYSYFAAEIRGIKFALMIHSLTSMSVRLALLETYWYCCSSFHNKCCVVLFPEPPAQQKGLTVPVGLGLHYVITHLLPPLLCPHPTEASFHHPNVYSEERTKASI